MIPECNTNLSRGCLICCTVFPALSSTNLGVCAAFCWVSTATYLPWDQTTGPPLTQLGKNGWLLYVVLVDACYIRRNVNNLQLVCFWGGFKKKKLGFLHVFFWDGTNGELSAWWSGSGFIPKMRWSKHPQAPRISNKGKMPGFLRTLQTGSLGI